MASNLEIRLIDCHIKIKVPIREETWLSKTCASLAYLYAFAEGIRKHLANFDAGLTSSRYVRYPCIILLAIGYPTVFHQSCISPGAFVKRFLTAVMNELLRRNIGEYE